MLVAEEMHFLAQLAGCTRCEELKHLVIGAKIPVTADDSAPQELLTYDVPPNFTLIVTRVGFRSVPEPDDAALTVGDWRSDDFDASGNAQAFFTVNDTPVTSTIASTFILFNNPVLFCFKGGDHVGISIQRFAADPPPTFVAQLAVNAYLAPASAYDRLTNNLTQIEATYS